MIFNPSEVNSSAGSNERAQAKLNMNELMPLFVAQLRELLRVPPATVVRIYLQCTCTVCG